MYLKDEEQPTRFVEPSKIRKGRFLWMDPGAQREYLQTLNARIASGYYYSDRILTEIVDEIAPIVEETIGGDSELFAT